MIDVEFFVSRDYASQGVHKGRHVRHHCCSGQSIVIPIPIQEIIIIRANNHLILIKRAEYASQLTPGTPLKIRTNLDAL